MRNSSRSVISFFFQSTQGTALLWAKCLHQDGKILLVMMPSVTALSFLSPFIAFSSFHYPYLCFTAYLSSPRRYSLDLSPAVCRVICAASCEWKSCHWSAWLLSPTYRSPFLAPVFNALAYYDLPSRLLNLKHCLGWQVMSVDLTSVYPDWAADGWTKLHC